MTSLFFSGLKATINPAMRPIVAKATKSANKVFFLCGAEQKVGRGVRFGPTTPGTLSPVPLVPCFPPSRLPSGPPPTLSRPLPPSTYQFRLCHQGSVGWVPSAAMARNDRMPERGRRI